MAVPKSAHTSKPAAHSSPIPPPVPPAAAPIAPAANPKVDVNSPKFAADQRTRRIARFMKLGQLAELYLDCITPIKKGNQILTVESLPDGVSLAAINKAIEIAAVQMRIECPTAPPILPPDGEQEIPSNVEPRNPLKGIRLKIHKAS